MAKRSSDPRVDYPEVKVQVGDLVRVEGIVAPFAPWGLVFGENSFQRAPVGKWAQETCAGCPQALSKCQILRIKKKNPNFEVRIPQ